MKKLFFFLAVIFSLHVSAQDSGGADSLLVKHMSFLDTFFGNEQEHQVCYPKDHRNFFYSIFGFAIIATTLGAMVIVIKTKSNKLLKQKNLIIEEKNHDLVSSITYAKRIQFSILPNTEFMNAFRDRMFVLYCPRDIVSGDFYWTHRKDSYLYMAVVDCTGHGVPGAFLSLIGHQAISKAVESDKITDPAQILNAMNAHVKQVLQQEENTELRDGMEVALCKLNMETNELEFAGANLNLTIISNNEVNVVKGGKCTVGSVQPHVKDLPKTHSIQLKQGDSFYFYSDGFVDQMGGEKGKKFMSVRLKELLQEVSKQPIAQRHELLRKAFNDWKGNNVQTDDVCLIGVSV